MQLHPPASQRSCGSPRTLESYKPPSSCNHAARGQGPPCAKLGVCGLRGLGHVCPSAAGGHWSSFGASLWQCGRGSKTGPQPGIISRALGIPAHALSVHVLRRVVLAHGSGYDAASHQAQQQVSWILCGGPQSGAAATQRLPFPSTASPTSSPAMAGRLDNSFASHGGEEQSHPAMGSAAPARSSPSSPRSGQVSEQWSWWLHSVMGALRWDGPMGAWGL